MSRKQIIQPAKKKTLNTHTNPTLFNRLDTFFEKRHYFFLGLILCINLLFCLLFFDVKVSLSGDDSDYIIYAYKFIQDFTWPGFRGALYPIFLSPFIAAFGIHLVLLKLLSAVCILLMFFFLYKAFFRRIPSSVLFITLLLLSFNSYLLFYESQTFSEPLFMLLQGIFFYLFCNYYISDSTEKFLLNRKQITHFVVIAIVALLLTLTRTVGYVAVAAVVIYFLIQKQWKNALCSFGVLGICFIIFNFIKQAVWPASGNSYSISSYLAKDMYNPTKGMETFGGFITRFAENAKGYLSRDLGKFMGLRAENTALTNVSVALTIVFIGLFIIALIIVWKKNKPLFFAGLYTLFLCATHFILLQADWQQERFMLVLYPSILLVLLGGLYYLLQKYKSLHFIFLIAAGIIFIGTVSHTTTKLKKHVPILQQNLRGNHLYGFTPDWQNFILMSQWAAKNVPDSAVIISRKPSISCIYSNRDFTGIYSVPAVEKSTIKELKPQPLKSLIAVDASLKQEMLTPYVRYVIIGPHNINGKQTNTTIIYELSKDTLDLVLPSFTLNNTEYTLDFEDFTNDIAINNNTLIYSPDELLGNLKKQNARYMLLASLRSNPDVAVENRIINTLQRYLLIISFKYPDIVKQECHTIGTKEPATLVELNIN